MVEITVVTILALIHFYTARALSDSDFMNNDHNGFIVFSFIFGVSSNCLFWIFLIEVSINICRNKRYWELIGNFPLMVIWSGAMWLMYEALMHYIGWWPYLILVPVELMGWIQPYLMNRMRQENG